MVERRMAQGRQIVRSLQGGAAVAGDVRQLVRDLDGQLERVTRDAQLIASELVTNAWRHGHGRDDRPIQVTITIDPPHLGIEVRDQGDGFERSAYDHDPKSGDHGGWGLVVVNSLSDAWGVRRNGGTCVWALIAN
jgi:anti-sigma regulatory factor (Ser/Thr protein kinase)